MRYSSLALLPILGLIQAVGVRAEDVQSIDIKKAPQVLTDLTLAEKDIEGTRSIQLPSGQVVRAVVRSDWPAELEEPEGLETFSLRPGCTPKPQSDDGEIFLGTNREVAKTVVAKADIEPSNLSVVGFHSSHPSDEDMRQQGIKKDCNYSRVESELRNVTVAAYLVVAKKESDNDFHLILEDAGCAEPSCRLTVEISGIPRMEESANLLTATRELFEHQWSQYTPFAELPGTDKYIEFTTPILVRVTGSMFYDADHPIDPATGTGPVGPEKHKPGSAWEVHPVTSFEFLPQTDVSLYALMSAVRKQTPQ